MTITSVSSREFNEDTSRAKNAAAEGPVFITDRGKPAHVLLSIEAYRGIRGGDRRIADAFALSEADDTAFEPPHADMGLRPPELT